MQADSVSHVDAKFGGRRLRFEIPRRHDVIVQLEKDLGSISAAWGRFNDGDWTVADVATILAAGHPPVPAPLREPLLSHRLAMPENAPPPKPPMRQLTVPEIWPVMRQRPLATYARLASAILTAAFLGMPAEAAVFDEDEPIIKASKAAA